MHMMVYILQLDKLTLKLLNGANRYVSEAGCGPRSIHLVLSKLLIKSKHIAACSAISVVVAAAVKVCESLRSRVGALAFLRP